MKIHVVIPYYKSPAWFNAVMEAMTGNSTGPMAHYTAVDMSGDLQGHYAFSFQKCRRLDLTANRKIGGAAIPDALLQGVSAVTGCDITVTVDPDALVMCGGWDARLVELFADPKMAVAAINPRSDTDHFRGQAEWNWMAFRTQWWLDNLGTFERGSFHDYGHLFTDAAKRTGMRQHLWPMTSRPFPGRAATICGDAVNPRFVGHAFYSSRRRDDIIPESERSWMLTAEEEKNFISECLK